MKTVNTGVSSMQNSEVMILECAEYIVLDT